VTRAFDGYTTAQTCNEAESAPRLRFDLFDSCARYKFSSFIHSFIQVVLSRKCRRNEKHVIILGVPVKVIGCRQ